MTSPPVAFYLPPGFAAAPMERETIASGRTAVPLELVWLTPASLRRLAPLLRSARERELASRPTEAIVAALGQTAERWLDRQYPPRAAAELWLPRVTGYAAATIRGALDTLFAGLRVSSLWGLIEEELGDRRALDAFVARRRLEGRCRAFGPRLTVLSCAGNVPVASLPSLFHALLVKSACLVRVARAEPLLPSLFLQSLAEEAPWLTGCVAAVTWADTATVPGDAGLPPGERMATHLTGGGDGPSSGERMARGLQEGPGSGASRELAERELGATGEVGACFEAGSQGHPSGGLEWLNGVEAWIGYGSDETLGAIRRSLPEHVRFVPHGHRIGFGVVTREVLTRAALERTATLAATDVAAFDQQGCVSPRLFFVEQGGERTPRDFAAAVARELEALREALPRCPLDAGAAAALHQRRAGVEMRQLAGEPVALWKSDRGTDWTVIVDPRADFSAAGGYRTAVIRPVERLTDLLPLLAPFQRYLQTATVAALEARWPEIAGLLGASGVTRLCSLGRTQEPGAGWHADGRPCLAELIGWVDWELRGAPEEPKW